MRELPEPDGYYFREDSLYIGGGEDIKTGDYRTETVLSIQKQAYEDGLRDAADRIEALEAVLRQAREALNDIGLDCASQVAGEYHDAMAGYRQYRHDALDADVETIKKTIAAIDAALKE